MYHIKKTGVQRCSHHIFVHYLIVYLFLLFLNYFNLNVFLIQLNMEFCQHMFRYFFFFLWFRLSSTE